MSSSSPHFKSRQLLKRWISRTRKELARSGRCREAAILLAEKSGNSAEQEEQWLRQLMREQVTPTPDELLALELVLFPPKKTTPQPDTPTLF